MTRQHLCISQVCKQMSINFAPGGCFWLPDRLGQTTRAKANQQPATGCRIGPARLSLRRHHFSSPACLLACRFALHLRHQQRKIATSEDVRKPSWKEFSKMDGPVAVAGSLPIPARGARPKCRLAAIRHLALASSRGQLQVSTLRTRRKIAKTSPLARLDSRRRCLCLVLYFSRASSTCLLI